MVPKGMKPEMGMNMMKKMMGGDNGNPMQMCKEMISSVKKTSEMSVFSTQELHSLFSEWLDTKKQDVLKAIDKSKPKELNEIAKRIKLTKESTAYLLARMAVKGELVFQIKKLDSTKKSSPTIKKTAKNKRKKTASKKTT